MNRAFIWSHIYDREICEYKKQGMLVYSTGFGRHSGYLENPQAPGEPRVPRYKEHTILENKGGRGFVRGSKLQ